MVRFVVMAAGQATRMKQDKLVLPWKDTTVLGYILKMILEAITLEKQRLLVVSSLSMVTEIVVVARHPLKSYLSEDSIKRFNSYAGTWIQVPSPKPLSETIHSGLRDLDSEVVSIGFVPGDQVGITAQGLADCLQRVRQNAPDFLVPIAGGIASSPVFFHKQYVPELLALQGEQGGREVLYRYPERWCKFPVEESFFQDVDTPEQYKALLGQIWDQSDG